METELLKISLAFRGLSDDDEAKEDEIDLADTTDDDEDLEDDELDGVADTEEDEDATLEE